MKRFFTVLALALVFAGCRSARPVKVLAIGNSFSICLHRHWPQVAAASGTPLDLCTLYIGGCSLKQHADNIRRGAGDASFRPYRMTRNAVGVRSEGTINIPEALMADEWDIVTIQQASHESWRPETFHPAADELVATIRRYAPNAEIRVQETWSYSDRDGRICEPQTHGAGSWGFDRTGMYQRLAKNYRDLCAWGSFRMIPTGSAIEEVRRKLPVADVADDVVGRKGDSIHLNDRGEYLQALVWQKSVFGGDVSKCAYAPASLAGDERTLAVIREAAERTGRCK